MGPYEGDISQDQTVVVYFDSHDDTGAAASLDTNGTVRVYKNATTTSDTASVTVTNDSPVTGLNRVEIDTSSGAAGFFEPGNDYHVLLEGADVGGATINAHLASFSIENRRNEHLQACEADTVTSASVFTLTGTGVSSTDDFYNGQLIIATSGQNQGIAREVLDYTGSTAELTCNAFPFTPGSGDRFQIMGLA